MPLSTQLQKISDWISTTSGAVKTAAEFSIESGFLEDTWKEICDRGGVAGSVFKLGGMFLDLVPEADAETRIARKLTHEFVKTLDSELAYQDPENEKPENPHRFVSKEAWKDYQQSGHVEQAAKRVLEVEFTWAKVLGANGWRPSRGWPGVNELAEFGRRIVWEASGGPEAEDARVRIFADTVSGKIRSALRKVIDEVRESEPVELEMRQRLGEASREALLSLNREYTTSKDAYLFDEVPQSAIYVSRSVKFADFSQTEVETNWDNVVESDNAEARLTDEINRRAGGASVLVLEGDMGVGKSCMMRYLISHFAGQYTRDKEHAVITANWRDIYRESDLTEGLKEYITREHGTPIQSLKDEENLIIFIDGFDEMNVPHDFEVVQYFQTLVKLAKQHSSPLVLAMRSTVVTETLRRAWKDENALVAKVSPLSDDEVNQWACQWAEYRNERAITGARLKKLCPNDKELTQNPLLLFMLARYVAPSVDGSDQSLSRAAIFGRFVDETIAGKARQSGESPGATVDERNFRFLLQEIAWIASWPKNGGKCPLRIVKERICSDGVSMGDTFGFENMRTAFVLQFFEPGTDSGEYEFHPEGFRHFLLAEWVVRTQFEAMKNDEVKADYLLGRSRADAIADLSQFTLQDVERSIVNDIFEELPSLLKSNDEKLRKQTERRFGGGLSCDQLLERLRRHVKHPPEHDWQVDNEVGNVLKDDSLNKALAVATLVRNYQDHALLAALALGRGIKRSDPDVGITAIDGIGDWAVTQRDGVWRSRFDFSQTQIRMSSLSGAALEYVNLSGSICENVSFINAVLTHGDLNRSSLRECRFERAFLRRANFVSSVLYRTIFSFADLNEAILVEADLRYALLRSANLTNANLTYANLTDADLTDADLTNADLTGAILTSADLTDADLTGADLTGAILAGAILTGANLTNTNLTDANLTNANLTNANLTNANLKSVIGLKRPE